jgi:LysR family transcriptional regulator of beta-lactamase
VGNAPSAHEWPRWFVAAGVACPALKGPVFDSCVIMTEAVTEGAGVALLPVAMVARDLTRGRLVQPFSVDV